MLVSKNGKRFMAWIMAMAFVLSGMAFVPKTASVAEAAGDPTAEVLGATLRLDKDGDNNGTQSMRIGIQVDNADQAKGCAIKLTVNDNSIIIGTNSDTPSYVTDGVTYKSAPTLYSKDESGNSVTYAVVLTGIPDGDAFDEGVSVEAIADNGIDVPTPVPDKNGPKSVNGIVDELKTRYDSLDIVMLGGTLYVHNGEDKLTARDILSYNDGSAGFNNNPDGNGWNSDGTEYTIPLTPGETILGDVDANSSQGTKTVITENEDGSITSSTTLPNDGFGIAPSEEIKDLPLTKATIYYSVIEGSYTRSYKYKDGEDIKWGESNFTDVTQPLEFELDSSRSLDYIKFWSGEGGASVTITKVVFTVDAREPSSGKQGIDLTEATAVENVELEKISGDGITVITGKDITGICIPLPSNVSNGESVNVTVYGNCSDEKPRLYLSNGKDIECSTKIEPMKFKKSYVLTANNADKEATHLMIKSSAYNVLCNMTITKVVIEKLEKKEYQLTLDENTVKDIIGDNQYEKTNPNYLKFDNGTVTATTEQGFDGFGIYIPDEVKNGSMGSITKIAITYQDGMYEGSTGFLAEIDYADSSTKLKGGNPFAQGDELQGDGVAEYVPGDFGAESFDGLSHIKFFSAEKSTLASVTITKVVLTLEKLAS